MSAPATGRRHRLEDGDWLRQRYQHDGLTLRQLAAELGCSDGTIRAALRRHGIPRRPRGPLPGSTILHGHNRRRRRTGAYRSWAAMITRCTNPESAAWEFYGARGVRICDRLRTFVGFLEVLGPRPDAHSIDRLDSGGHYSCGDCEHCRREGWPANVRWATRAEQVAGQRQREAACELERIANGGHA